MATERRGRIEVNLQLLLERHRKMIKKLMMMFVVAMAAIGAWAATETVNGITWTYTVSGGSATITYVPTSISNQVEIPQSLNGYQVTGIGS